MSDVRLRSLDWKQMEGTDIGRDYTEGEKGALAFILACSEHIICPVFVARDLSGLGWSLKEGHDDTSTGTTGGETDAG